jgi:exodeoxyribonuclease VII small subunit
VSTAEDQGTGPTTTYEQAREELAEVVRRLEAGGLTLEESLALWERGERLAELCQHWLDRARERLAAATGEGSRADQPG